MASFFPIRFYVQVQLTICGKDLICMAACNHGQMYDIPILVLKPVIKPPLWDDDEGAEEDDQVGIEL